MAQDPNQRKIVRNPGGGVVQNFVDYAKLIMRLMIDQRVNWLVKLIPIGSLVYMLNPLDIPGPLDDAAIVGLAMYLFVELCPESVVEEHRQRLQGVMDAQWSEPRPSGSAVEHEEVIEGEFREETDDNQPAA